jgi:hypothetical protein
MKSIFKIIRLTINFIVFINFMDCRMFDVLQLVCSFRSAWFKFAYLYSHLCRAISMHAKMIKFSYYDVEFRNLAKMLRHTSDPCNTIMHNFNASLYDRKPRKLMIKITSITPLIITTLR